MEPLNGAMDEDSFALGGLSTLFQALLSGAGIALHKPISKPISGPSGQTLWIWSLRGWMLMEKWTTFPLNTLSPFVRMDGPYNTSSPVIAAQR
jgi:hypothetical protein